MSDQEDKSPVGELLSSDECSIPPEQDAESDTPQLEEQETSDADELDSANHRLDLQDGHVSEVSSIDASLVDSLPRRAGSPVDSVISGRGDSLQVNPDHELVKLSHLFCHSN